MKRYVVIGDFLISKGMRGNPGFTVAGTRGVPGDQGYSGFPGFPGDPGVIGVSGTIICSF